MPGAGDDPSNPLTATEVESQVEPLSTFEKFAVPIVFTIFVVFRAADRVFLKAVSDALNLTEFNLVFSNIIWPFAMQIITICMVSAYVIGQRMKGNKQYGCSFFLLGNKNASSMGAIPTHMLALFCLGDQLNATLSSPASAFVSQPSQSILTNFVLLWTAIVGWFWIKTRFKMVHYVGMSLVVVASVIQFAPFVANNDCDYDFPVHQDDITCFEAYRSNADGGEWKKMGSSQMLFFYLLFVVSTVPAAVSNVYKQKVLQGVDADIIYVTLWAGWFQLLWGWLSIPTLWIPLPGQTTLHPQDTFKAIGQTFTCISGKDPIGNVPSCTQAPPPWVYIILYFAFNASFNLAITWLIKRISATWVQIATVLCLNLTDIFSSMKLIMGKSAQPMTPCDWAGLFVMSIALWVYNLQPEITADGKESRT